MKTKNMVRCLRFPILLIAVTLNGCIGVAGLLGGHVNAYDGPALPDVQVATIIHPQGGRGLSSRASLQKVDGTTYGDELLRGWPSIVKVLPGTHKIDIKCFVANHFGFVAVVQEFEAGHYYELSCVYVGNDRGRGQIDDRGTEDPRRKKGGT